MNATRQSFDAIIIGGGIYGVMLAYQAALQKKQVLLLEKNDFGGATSFNSLKTIHGGLRYLQKFNLKLFRQFVNERRWFIRHFPTLVKPLGMLMPLYGIGVQRKSIMRAALLTDKLFSLNRNRGLRTDRKIHFGKVLNQNAVINAFPGVRKDGLTGGALWYDACMPDSQRLLIEVLKRACQLGATAINYCSVEDLAINDQQITGVAARDQLTNRRHQFSAKRVFNCAGQQVRQLAEKSGNAVPELFYPSLAWNILFDREALSHHALAVSTPQQIFFLHPWKGRLLAGTGHAPRTKACKSPQPDDHETEHFIGEINLAVPGLNLKCRDIQHVYAGYLPAKHAGSSELSQQDLIHEHAKTGGPGGFFSISGTKYTTARIVARKALSIAFPAANASETPDKSIVSAPTKENGVFDFQWMPERGSANWMDQLGNLSKNESVVHLDDLVLRRTNLGDNPERALTLAPALCNLFDWDDTRRAAEIRRLEAHFHWFNREAIYE